MVIPLGVLLRDDLGRRGRVAPGQSGRNQSPAKIEIATLVLREGLECVLVLAAVTAGLRGAHEAYRPAIAAGAGTGFAATLVTWRVAARVLDDIGRHSSALALQAGTGLLAIIVLLVVMNWFFHRLYWTGWISLHQQKKQNLLRAAGKGEGARAIGLGMASLGFTSFYREGFEVVLFLQSYRLRLGNAVVVDGVMLGMLASGIVAVLTFVAQRRLPYRRLLIATGLMLSLVLLVMVGEEAQEMQLAGWLPATKIPWLTDVIPSWMGFWFSLFPIRESLGGQVLAGILVFGSYFASRFFSRQRHVEAPR
jgi:high-affinity iron transporter